MAISDTKIKEENKTQPENIIAGAMRITGVKDESEMENVINEMKGLETHIGGIESEIARLPGTATIPEVMNVEGRIRNIYYTALDEIFPENYRIIKRSRMPSSNRMNTLISFGNSLMYTTTLSEIYNTQLKSHNLVPS